MTVGFNQARHHQAAGCINDFRTARVRDFYPFRHCGYFSIFDQDAALGDNLSRHGKYASVLYQQLTFHLSSACSADLPAVRLWSA